jgi:hypothetical protein
MHERTAWQVTADASSSLDPRFILYLEIPARLPGSGHHIEAGLTAAFEAQGTTAVAEDGIVRDVVMGAPMALAKSIERVAFGVHVGLVVCNHSNGSISRNSWRI